MEKKKEPILMQVDYALAQINTLDDYPELRKNKTNKDFLEIARIALRRVWYNANRI